MKKGLVFALAALCVAAFSVPAGAMDLENIFGGYFDVRPTTQQDFAGQRVNGDDGDASFVDSRTRIYYFAKFSDNFRFVNRWEMDAIWGNSTNNDGPGQGGGSKASHGGIGADAINVETKNTFLEFKFEPYEISIGTQGGVLNRSFLFDGDYSGIAAAYRGEVLGVEASWYKQIEGGNDSNSSDVDQYNLRLPFKFGDNVSLVPGATLLWSDNGSEWPDFFYAVPQTFQNVDEVGDVNVYYLTLDADFDFEMFDLWFTGIYQGGVIKDPVVDGDQEGDVDVKAYLLAAGVGLDVGPVELHSEAFYATGNRSGDDLNDDLEAFTGPNGQSYYWSEIMGLGILGDRNAGNTTSAGSPGDGISNIMAINLGASMKPVEKMKVALDIWYAELVERVQFDNSKQDELGTEVDLVITYNLLDNVKLDLVGAYLFAGDATSITGNNRDDPYEIGSKLSLSF